MNRTLTSLTSVALAALTLSLAACGGSDQPEQPFEATTIQVTTSNESVVDIVVDGRVDLEDGASWSLTLRGARYTLDVSDADGTTVHELRDAQDDLVVLAEFPADGSSHLMNAQGVLLMAEAGTDPLADPELAALFDAAVPVLLDGQLVSELDALDGPDGLETARSALRGLETGLRCSERCESGVGAICCCSTTCWADAKGCGCGEKPKLAGFAL